MNKEAAALNEILKRDNPAVFNLLSETGKRIFFPKLGILAQAADAQGKRYNATVGEGLEDDGTPMRLPSLANLIKIDPKDAFPYPFAYGKKELRKKWKEHIAKMNPSLSGKYSMPVATCALTHGLSTSAKLFLNSGEKLILHDVYWSNYDMIFRINSGCILDKYNTFSDGKLDLQSFNEKLRGPGKKVVVFNYPNSPSGYMPSEKEVNELVKIINEHAEQNEIAIILDDAYAGLVYEDVFRESLFSKLADVHENVLAIKIDGPTKEDYVWGFRVGFITFACKGITEHTCDSLENKAAGMVRSTVSVAPHVSQGLLLKAMDSSTYEEEKKEKYELLRKRYLKFKEVLNKYKLETLPFNAGYFLCIKTKNAEQVRQALLQKYDTGVISSEGYIRIALSCVPESDIEAIVRNIHDAFKDAGNLD